MERFLDRLIRLEIEVETLYREQRELLMCQRQRKTLETLRYENWVLCYQLKGVTSHTAGNQDIDDLQRGITDLTMKISVMKQGNAVYERDLQNACREIRELENDKLEIQRKFIEQHQFLLYREMKVMENQLQRESQSPPKSRGDARYTPVRIRTNVSQDIRSTLKWEEPKPFLKKDRSLSQGAGNTLISLQDEKDQLEIERDKLQANQKKHINAKKLQGMEFKLSTLNSEIQSILRRHP